MFRCDRCHMAIGPGIPPIMVVIQSRPRVYENFIDGVHIESRGWEIVREDKLCKRCASIVTFIKEAEAHEVTPMQKVPRSFRPTFISKNV